MDIICIFLTRVQHHLPCRSYHSSTSIPPHLTDAQYADVITSHFSNYLCAFSYFVHSTDVPLPNLHNRFWREQLSWRFRRHSLSRTVIRLGVCICSHHTIWCSDITVTCSGFGFCNDILQEGVNSPLPNPQPGAPAGFLLGFSIP